MKIQFLGSHTITLSVIQAASTQKPEMPWKTWQPTPETNPARSLPRLCLSVTTISKPCCPVNKTANAQFDTSVQLLQSQPPMQMSDCLQSTQQHYEHLQFQLEIFNVCMFIIISLWFDIFHMLFGIWLINAPIFDVINKM
jgi:hypothetical protein